VIYLSKQQRIHINFHSSCSVREQLIPNSISAAVHGSRTKLSGIIHLIHKLLKTAHYEFTHLTTCMVQLTAGYSQPTYLQFTRYLSGWRVVSCLHLWNMLLRLLC